MTNARCFVFLLLFSVLQVAEDARYADSAVASPSAARAIGVERPFPPAVSKLALPSALEDRTGVVRVERLLLRSGVRGAILGQLTRGAELTLLARRDGWREVALPDGRTGWVAGGCIDVREGPRVPPAPVVNLPAPVEPCGPPRPPIGLRALPSVTGTALHVRTTGYYPPPRGGYRSRAEARREGGATGTFGKLRTLQAFDARDPHAYVSCATDPRVIRTGTTFTIDQYPGVAFLACDTGGKVKGAHVDICVKDRIAASRVTGTATIRFAR